MTRKKGKTTVVPHRFDGTATPGRSLLQHLWDELDVAFAALQAPKVKHRHRMQGLCLGLATAIAIIENGYAPNVEGVKRRVYKRWEQGNARQDARRTA